MIYIPFDDAQTTLVFAEPAHSGSAFPYDHLRQGVEINNSKYFFLGAQPKLWAGGNNFVDGGKTTNAIDHSVRPITYGQAISFTEYEGHSRFDDLSKFDVGAFIAMGDDYPGTIELNEGPMQQQEAIIEPFTIPFRLPTNEGPIYSHKVWGELEDGNNFLNSSRSANRILQFIDLKTPVSTAFFLDSGGYSFGQILIENHIANIEKLVEPFNDTQLQAVANTVNTTDQTLITNLYNLDFNLDDDLRPNGMKSACAGFIFIGSAGTDSVAFGGWAKGY